MDKILHGIYVKYNGLHVGVHLRCIDVHVGLHVMWYAYWCECLCACWVLHFIVRQTPQPIPIHSGQVRTVLFIPYKTQDVLTIQYICIQDCLQPDDAFYTIMKKYSIKFQINPEGINVYVRI